MTRCFIELPLFTKRWSEINLSDDDLLLLQKALLKNPEIGPMIEGTGGIRKVRYALPYRGKRGSVRVYYVDFSSYGRIYLITAHTKSERESLSDSEKAILRSLVKSLKAEIISGRKHA